MEKTLGHITILAPAPLIDDEITAIQLSQMPCVPSQSPEQRLHNNLLLQHAHSQFLYGFCEGEPGFGRNDMLFDGDVYTHPRGDFTSLRILLRSARLGEPRSVQGDLLEGHRMTEANWIAAPEEAKNGEKLLEAFEAAVPNPLCELCGVRAGHTCGQCYGAWYCGREHQKKDWKEHKPLCRKIKKGDPEFFK